MGIGENMLGAGSRAARRLTLMTCPARYYRDEDERRPEKYTGDRITRNTNRVRNKEARVLAGYPAYAKTGRRVALEEARYVWPYRALWRATLTTRVAAPGTWRTW